MTQEKTIWVFTDNRAGNNAQALGVAESTGYDFEIKRVEYTKAAVLPNFLRGSSTIGIARETLEQLQPPFPDFIIAAGRRAAPLARFIKKRSNGKTKIIQIMFPGLVGLNDFDLVVLPRHDGFTQERANILRLIGAPNRVTEEKLAQEKTRWHDALKDLPKPRIALIVGGKTKNKPFTLAHAEELAFLTNALRQKTDGGSLMVTTSRRTGEKQEEKLRSLLSDPKFFYSYQDGGDNPYFGFLAHADAVIVTGDSMSMCSEACATTAPVFIYAPDGFCAKKHQRLHKELYKEGYARPLTPDAFDDLSTHIPLNEAAIVARRIKND